ncbi:hypothetical protein NQ318_013577 [Aromia moschata]|uniref:Uncharacterized protein n=1 Tax=Aromia moschata TaxID=1265417 RepID=A0AAV8YFG2_9CUCU|nr:hypothetical protein NQ318_013577 [Aromia moschata]
MEADSVLCRLCLDVVPVGYTLDKETVLNTIKILTSVDILENDSLPKLSCSKCIFNLYFVENVRKMIINSDEKLHSALLRDGNVNELLKRPSPVERSNPTETASLVDEPTFANVEIKEEKVVPLFTEISEEQDLFDNNLNEEESSKEENIPVRRTKSGKESGGDNFISSIIYRKNNKRPFVYHCTVCNVEFCGNKLYYAHKNKHLKKTCEICGVTTRLDNFNKHMTGHTLGQQICDICGSVHKSLEGLRTHLFHFHNAKKKPYTCTECGEKFKYSHRLTYHKRKVHTGFRPHQCETCGKRFFDLGTLKKHVKLIHLKLREYHCKYCQKDYSSPHALKVHIRQHTDETPYVCEYCTEGFRQLVSLKTHLARYHKQEKPSTSQTEEGEERDDENESKSQILSETQV